LLPKISKFTHYRKLRHKNAYIHSIKKIIEKEKIISYFTRNKIRGIRHNLDIFIEVINFLKEHERCIIFISIDNHQYLSFRKMVNIADGENTLVKKESELIKGTAEYQTSLVLDTLLNIERLRKKQR